MELLQMSVRTLNEKIRSKALGVAETVSALQKRMAETEPAIVAFLKTDEEMIKHNP